MFGTEYGWTWSQTLFGPPYRELCALRDRINARRTGSRRDGEGMMLASDGLPDRYVSEPGAETPAFRRSLELSARQRAARRN